MKNKAQEESFSAPRRPKNIISSQDNEHRIEYLRKAWQDGSLKINTFRLAQRMVDFETKVEPSLPNTPTGPEH